jgi:hypothetical protein
MQNSAGNHQLITLTYWFTSPDKHIVVGGQIDSCEGLCPFQERFFDSPFRDPLHMIRSFDIPCVSDWNEWHRHPKGHQRILTFHVSACKQQQRKRQLDTGRI